MEGSEGVPVRPHPETGRLETNEQRLDRNLLELLNELRVALPGVQVLFAFLLIVPFSPGYDDVTALQEKVYFVTLLCTGAATVCLIAPSVHHRIAFREQDKEHLVMVANRMAIVGQLFLAAAMVGVVLLITDVLFGTAATILTTAGAAAGFAVIWYAIPIRRKLTRER